MLQFILLATNERIKEYSSVIYYSDSLSLYLAG